MIHSCLQPALILLSKICCGQKSKVKKPLSKFSYADKSTEELIAVLSKVTNYENKQKKANSSYISSMISNLRLAFQLQAVNPPHFF